MSELALVILICSLIQSIFGVGLLVLGTPILLFLGYSFPAALFHLLPCSILISSLQLRDDFDQTRRLARKYVIFLVPSCAVGAAIVLLSDGHFNIRIAVGLMLLVSAVLRLNRGGRDAVARRLTKGLPVGLAAIGLIHGMTNMGGGPLAALVNVLFVEKTAARANIAMGYWIMAVIQFGLLLLLKGSQGSFGVVVTLMGLALFAYSTLGRKMFDRSPPLAYQHAMTALMVLCGVLLFR